MRRYWLVNPRSEGSGTDSSVIEEQKQGKYVQMGWSEEDCPKFYQQIEAGDIIVVTHGSHKNSEVEFVGIAAGEVDSDNQKWNLSEVYCDPQTVNAVQSAIRENASMLKGGNSNNPWGPTRSIIEIVPDNDGAKAVIAALDKIC